MTDPNMYMQDSMYHSIYQQNPPLQNPDQIQPTTHNTP